MKFGVREIADVCLRAKSAMKLGNKFFYKDEPVLYFDTLKTSSLEGAATTVYAQGGRGNARLMSWDGERTLTWTMEDALISAESFSVLSGAGLVDVSDITGGIKQHVTYTFSDPTMSCKKTSDTSVIYTITDMEYVPYFATTADKTSGEQAAQDADSDNQVYAMFMLDGEIITEPYVIGIAPVYDTNHKQQAAITLTLRNNTSTSGATNDTIPAKFDAILVDYYTVRSSDAMEINITADKFGSSFYLEGSTLFRTEDGVDMPAEFIIPNCRIQSNFTFSMASSGDPSTFTFTMDCFPDYTRFDKSEKVLAKIQVITDVAGDSYKRIQTASKDVIKD